jgi:hypothetical protein
VVIVCLSFGCKTPRTRLVFAPFYKPNDRHFSRAIETEREGTGKGGRRGALSVSPPIAFLGSRAVERARWGGREEKNAYQTSGGWGENGSCAALLPQNLNLRQAVFSSPAVRECGRGRKEEERKVLKKCCVEPPPQIGPARSEGREGDLGRAGPLRDPRPP